MPTNVLSWDAIGERFYETGVNHGAFYPYNASSKRYNPGVAWNGLTAITETPSGAEPTDIYADNIKYLTLRSAETLGGTIEAFTYPDEFDEVNGNAEFNDGIHYGQQKRGTFGLAYESRVGNDTQFEDYDYKIHLVYGASVSPSERAYNTINDSPEAVSFSWEFTTTPVDIKYFASDVTKVVKPTALITIETKPYLATNAPAKSGTGTYSASANLALLKSVLYGTDTAADITTINTLLGLTDTAVWDGTPWLPLPDDVFKILDYMAAA